MAKKQQNPIGFGHKPMPDEAGQAPQEQPTEPQLAPPLVEPIYVDDVVMYEFFKRYNLLPLTPVSKFEYQLVQVCAALEQRIRELDPDL